MQVAIVGGTNLEEISIPYREQPVVTPYGDVIVFRGALETGQDVIFLSRHGVLTRADPADINYRANIYALYSLGVTHIIGLSSVGACDYAYKLGTVCLINDFIDFTKNRAHSFDREHRLALHTGMEDVCCPDLNDALEKMIDQGWLTLFLPSEAHNCWQVRCGSPFCGATGEYPEAAHQSIALQVTPYVASFARSIGHLIPMGCCLWRHRF